jgi:hypothetical protein
MLFLFYFIELFIWMCICVLQPPRPNNIFPWSKSYYFIIKFEYIMDIIIDDVPKSYMLMNEVI